MRRLALATLFIALPALAHRIDRIDVASGSRVPAAIVVAETRLKPGRDYTDDDLQQAVYRVRRLPFVLAATYRVEGDALVIVINDTKPLFYSFEAFGYDFANGGGGAATRLTAGYRFFLGSRSVLEAGIGGIDDSGGGGDLSSATVQYSVYDLFGTRAFASVSVAKQFMTGDRETDPTISASAGFPLTRVQSIRATFNRSGENSTTSYHSPTANLTADVSREARLITLKWEIDRTDDPFFALRGFSASAGPEWLREKTNFPILTGFPKPRYEPNPRTSDQDAVAGTFKQYLPKSASTAFWGRADVARSTRDSKGANGNFTIDDTTGELTLGIAHNTGKVEELLTRGRWEAGVGYRASRTEGTGFSSTSNGLEATGGYTFRHQWGFVRVNFTYVSD